MSDVCAEPKIISPTHTLVRTLFGLINKPSVSLHTQMRFVGSHKEICLVRGSLTEQDGVTIPLQRKLTTICAAIEKTVRVSPANGGRHHDFLSAEFADAGFSISVRHSEIPLMTQVIASHMGMLKTAPQALITIAGI